MNKMYSHRRLQHSLICVFAFVLSDSQATDVVQWRDGTTTESQSISGWALPHPQSSLGHNATFSLESATIEGKRLFNANNPVRAYRNTDLRPALRAPYVVMSNGDILPGQVIGGSSTDGSLRKLHFVHVVPQNPLASRYRGQGSVPIRVRMSDVAMIVTTTSVQRNYSPGLVVFQDGRQIVAKDLVLTPTGVQLLLERSIETATWGEVTQIHLLKRDRRDALIRDSLISARGKVDLLCKTKTSNGAVLTHHFERVQSAGVNKGQRYHVVQPEWAYNGILIPIEHIASVDYRKPESIPLSQLPAQTLLQKNLTGFTWQWQRDQNVHRRRLSVGGRWATSGIGTHAYSQIAFDLPKGAKSFSAHVGIDDVVGKGGCAQCKVYKDHTRDEPLWSSGYLRGGQDPLPVNIVDLQNAKQLILVTEFAEKGHPKGADPLDIGDAVSWLHPFVRVELPRQRSTNVENVTSPIPALRGWSLASPAIESVSTQTKFVVKDLRWVPSMIGKPSDPGKRRASITIQRRVKVTIEKAWLRVATARDTNDGGYGVSVYVDGKQIPATEGYDSNTASHMPGRFDPVAYSLGHFVGKTIDLTVTARPTSASEREKGSAGIIWGELSFTPLIRGMTGGQPIVPDVRIEDVKTFQVHASEDKPDQDKQSATGKDTRMWSLPMTSGLSRSPDISEFTCRLDPKWKRFVACVGPESRLWNPMSFEIFVDDEFLWRSETFTRLTPGQQVDVPLPPNSKDKLIRLRVVTDEKRRVSWGNAGFMLK